MLLLSIMEPQVHLNCQICEARIKKKREKERRRKERIQGQLCEVCGRMLSRKIDLSIHLEREHKNSETRRSLRIRKIGERQPSRLFVDEEDSKNVEDIEELLLWSGLYTIDDKTLQEMEELDLYKIDDDSLQNMAKLDHEEIKTILD